MGTRAVRRLGSIESTYGRKVYERIRKKERSYNARIKVCIVNIKIYRPNIRTKLTRKSSLICTRIGKTELTFNLHITKKSDRWQIKTKGLVWEPKKKLRRLCQFLSFCCPRSQSVPLVQSSERQIIIIMFMLESRIWYMY